MARVFVSFASEDHELAAQMHDWLVAGGNEVFLDRDLHDGIAVGEVWERRLYERLRWADAVLCLVTAAYRSSVWCAAEIGIACSQGNRLLPVLAEPGQTHPLLPASQYQYTDLRDPGTARAALAEALRRIDAAGGLGWPDDRPPFPGLRPFDIDWHRVFFGRRTEAEELASLLRSPAESTADKMLVVIGPSGCGKSSLVRAGLIPVMAAEPGWLTLSPMLPGTDPVGALGRELALAARKAGLDWTVAQGRERLDRVGLTETADELLLAGAGRWRRLLVVVDQFEELLTRTPPADLARFAKLLTASSSGPVRTVVTLRPEFLDRMLVDPHLSGVPAHPYPIRPLARESLRAVVEGPARLAGIEVDHHLVDRLMADTATGEALPLLAYTLAELADGVGRGGRLLTSRYDQLGGVRGALARQADLALAEAVATGRRRDEEVLAGLLRLVTVDEEGRPTRSRVIRDELPDPLPAEMDAFVTRRLLTTDTENDRVVIGVAHEAFLTAWPPLRQAIEAAASALRARRAVENSAAEWSGAGRDPRRLWERGTLAASVSATGARFRSPDGRGRRRVLVTDRVELSGTAREFLTESIRRDRHRRGRAVTVLSVLLIMALTAAGVAVIQQRAAVRQQMTATAGQLTALAAAARDTDPRTALRLAVAADRIHPGPDTKASLVDILTTTRYAGTLTGHPGTVLSAAFSPNGRIAATGSLGEVILWDFTDPARPRPLGRLRSIHNGAAVGELVFTPDGRTLVTASSVRTEVLLWDVTRPGEPHRLGAPLTEQDQPVYALAVSPDGRTLAVGGRDGTIALWDVTEPAKPRLLRRPTSALDKPVSDLSFSPDGRTLAAGSYMDTKILLWDVSKPAAPDRVGGPLTTPPDASGVYAMAFSPAHDVLAAGDSKGAVHLWDLSDPARPRTLGEPLTGHSELVRSVAFARDGRTLATGSEDATVILWDLSDRAKPSRVGTLAGHGGAVHAAAFAPDGNTLLTGSQDTTAIVWDLLDPARPRPQGEALTGGGVAAFSPNGRVLATSASMYGSAGDEHKVILWDLADPARPAQLGELRTDREGSVNSLAFSPDGRTLASTSTLDKTVVLWDVTAPDNPRRLGSSVTGHTGSLKGTAFSPSGRVLAGISGDDLILWDVTDPARPHRIGRPLTAPSASATPESALPDGLEFSAIAFSPDGQTLATGGSVTPADQSNNTVILWDVTHPDRPRRLGSALTGNRTVAFSRDGRLLATGNAFDNTVTLWDVADVAHPRRLGQPLTGHTKEVMAVAFSPDGHTLASADVGNTIILWDLTDRTQPRRLGQPLNGHDLFVDHMTFSPDGTTLATGSSSGNDVILWNLTGLNQLRSQAAQRACATAGTLDRDQWLRYLRDLPYQNTCAPAQ